MDKVKAKLIFDKFNEILEIADVDDYFTITMCDGFLAFNNNPDKEGYYSFGLVDGEIERFR